MTALWDTTLVSRLRPGGALAVFARERATAGVPVRVAAPVLMEVAYGWQLTGGDDRGDPAPLTWLSGLVAQRRLTVVPFDGLAAVVAGRLRARLPHAPRRSTDRRSKTMRQAAWLMDIHIAATAFGGGVDVATRNRADFELLRDALVDLFPTAPPLDVVDGPV